MSESTENLTVEPDAQLTRLSSTNYTHKKLRILLMLLGYTALLEILLVIGFIFDLEASLNPMNFVIQIPSIALILWWCLVDAEQHDHSIGRVMRIALIMVTLIAFPIYIFQTRGLAGFKTLFLAILFLFAMCVCSVVTEWLAMFVGEWSGFISPVTSVGEGSEA